MTSDVEHFYVCVGFCMSLGKCPFKSSLHFKVRLSFVIELYEFLVEYILNSNPFIRYIVCKLGLPRHFVDCYFCCAEAFKSNIVPLVVFASVACAFTGLVSYPKKSLPSPMWKNEERNSVMGQTFHSSLETKRDWKIEIIMFLFKDAFLSIELEGERVRRGRRGRENIQYLHLFYI